MPYSYTSPPGWTTTRKRILARDDGICYLCGHPGATQVDHIQPVSQGGSHDDHNLAAIHADPCHRNKSEQERSAGKRRRTTRRTAERHPGIRA